MELPSWARTRDDDEATQVGGDEAGGGEAGGGEVGVPDTPLVQHLRQRGFVPVAAGKRHADLPAGWWQWRCVRTGDGGRTVMAFITPDGTRSFDRIRASGAAHRKGVMDFLASV